MKRVRTFLLSAQILRCNCRIHCFWSQTAANRGMKPTKRRSCVAKTSQVLRALFSAPLRDVIRLENAGHPPYGPRPESLMLCLAIEHHFGSRNSGVRVRQVVIGQSGFRHPGHENDWRIVILVLP